MSEQTKIASLLEAITNTATGFLFSFVIQKTLNHAYDVDMSNETAAWFVFWFTVASVVRSYVVRRIWNGEWLRRLMVKWRYRNVDPDVCCCGDLIGKGGSICGHGGCRSAKEYAMTTELERDSNAN